MEQSKLYKQLDKIITNQKLSNSHFNNTPTIVPITYIICNWDILFNNMQEFNNTHDVVKTHSCNCKTIPDGIVIVWNNSWIKYNCPTCNYCNTLHILHVRNNDRITIMIYITSKLSLIPLHIW